MSFNQVHENIGSGQQLFTYPSAKIWTTWKHICSFTSIRVHHWLYDHPTTRKVAEVAAYTIGVGVIAAAAFATSPLMITGIAIGGALIIGITYVASRILNCLVPMRHDMKDHAFSPEKLERNGKLLGELYYDGEVPILRIDSEDPYESGYTQGYLLRDALASLYRNIELCLFTLAREKRPSKIGKILDVVKSKIPEKFLLELQGLVDGYNSRKGLLESTITLEDLLYLQLMPDRMYFNPSKVNATEKEKEEANPLFSTQAVACTLTALYDKDNVPLFARTLDWFSFGNLGRLSLVISRINSATRIRVAEVSVPGFIGSLTGINSSGLSVAMNVTPYEKGITTIEGIPAAFYNRMILENCHTFDQAEKFIASQKPMGPYHLSVSDQAKAGTFSMYQKEDWTNAWSQDRHNNHRLRLLTKQDVLITTNCSCNPEKHDMFNGKYRKSLIKDYLERNSQIQDPKEILSHTQSIPWVNNPFTTHGVIMGSKTLEVAFDNAWSGDRDLHPVDLAKLFG
ncbi:MAG: C45 family autoproteolytic acyltransferase/hydrolase [Chlamydiales bacterium]|nr:C45 family autoproteolytic acyltransferase/hydrolase [Chlamydiales bacterium]